MRCAASVERILTITSCRTLRVASDILSKTDTTVAQCKSTAKKERIMKPRNEGQIITNLPKQATYFVSASRVTYAVKPTAEEPFPDAETLRGHGVILCTYCKQSKQDEG